MKLIFIIASLSATYAGMAGLCLSMARHYKQIFEQAPGLPKQRLLYWSGWLLLALALVYSIGAWGAALGSVAWFGALTAATGLLVVLIAYQHRLALALAGASLALSIISSAYLAFFN